MCRSSRVKAEETAARARRAPENHVFGSMFGGFADQGAGASGGAEPVEQADQAVSLTGESDASDKGRLGECIKGSGAECSGGVKSGYGQQWGEAGVRDERGRAGSNRR
jgi:hypothetical protein